jgi:hypothetical protein
MTVKKLKSKDFELEARLRLATSPLRLQPLRVFLSDSLIVVEKLVKQNGNSITKNNTRSPLGEFATGESGKDK